MDDTGALRSFPSLVICPGTHFLRTGREESLEVQQFVRRFDEAVYAGFLEADFLQEHLPFIVGLELSDFTLNLSGYHQDFSILIFHSLAHSLNIMIPADGAPFVHVANVEHRLVGQ